MAAVWNRAGHYISAAIRWRPQQIAAGFASWLRYCSNVAQRRSTKLCTLFDHLLDRLVHYIYIFRGSCPVTEFCHVQNSLCVQVLHSPISTALLHGTPAACVSRTLQLGTSNGIMALSQRAPPIFGWVAITLGIGPHSSFGYICGPLKFNSNTFQVSVTLFRGPGCNRGIGNSNTAHAWGNTRDRQTTVEILTF